MKITVIIPTYHRVRTLLQALQSLQQQTFDAFEILVVDNSAESSVSNLINEFNRTAKIKAKYIHEPRVGVHYARNAAALIACGGLLLYADDDMSFAPDWVGAYARAFEEHPEMGAAAGPVRAYWDQPPQQWLLEFIDRGNARCFTILSLMDLYDGFKISASEGFFSCNMAIRKNVLIARGGFNPENTAGKWVGDGESGLNRRMWEFGDLIGYVPAAINYHHIPTERMTPEYFRRRMANEGASNMYANYHGRVPRRFRLLRMAQWLVRRNFWLWVEAWKVWGQTDFASLDVQMRAAQTQSEVRYVMRLVWDIEFRKLVQRDKWLS